MAKPSNISQRVSESFRKQVNLQNVHLAALKSIENVVTTDEHRDKLVSLGWAGLLQEMQGESYPPSSEDWQRWLKLSEDQTPIKLGLDKVEDPLLRSQLQLLGSAADIAMRLSALAKFCKEIVGARSQKLDSVFSWWAQRSAVEGMLAQIKEHEPNDSAGLQILRITLQAFDVIGGGIEELGIDPSNRSEQKLLTGGSPNYASHKMISTAAELV